MNWTWLGLITAAFLIFSCFVGFRRGFIKEAVSTFLVLLSFVGVWFVNPYVNTFIRENTPVYREIQESVEEFAKEKTGRTGESGTEEKQKVLEEMGVPEIIAENILKNSSQETYSYLSAQSFIEYISGYMATIVVNGISFFLSFFLVTVSIRMVTYALNLIARLPVVHGVNKIAGGLLGGVKAILFIWVAMLILTIFCETSVGKAGFDMIEKDNILRALYENNILAKLFTGIFYGR